MTTLKLEITKEIKQEIELEVPSFYKVGSAYIAILDESDIYKVYNDEMYTSVQSGTFLVMKSDLTKCNLNNQITEQEFFDFYKAALKNVTLTPHLVYTAGQDGIETNSTIV